METLLFLRKTQKKNRFIHYCIAKQSNRIAQQERIKMKFRPICLVLIIFLFAPYLTQAQFIGTDPSSAPSLDGTISSNEYGTYTGVGTNEWYLCWDNTYLYIAKTGGSSGEPAVFVMDIDPITTSTDYVSGGSNTNGNLTSKDHFNHTIRSPFRADVSVYFTENYVEYWERDGSGGWTQQTESDPILIDDSDNSGLNREIRIRWSDLPGLSGRPDAFNWYGYHFNPNSTPGNDFVFHETPSDNPGGSVNGTNFYFNFYHSVTNTTSTSTTDPFNQLSFEWRDGSDYTLADSKVFYDVTNNSANKIILLDGSATETIQVNNELKTGNGIDIQGDEILQLNSGSNIIINTGGFIDVNLGTASLNYNSNSTLTYNTNTTFGRFDEWTSTSGSGYPGNVTIANNSTLNLGNNGTGVARQMAGNLSIESGSTLSTNETGSKMTAALTIVGNVTNNGTITLSDQSGGDLNVQGNWVDNATLNQNGRTVSLNGSSAQDISGSSVSFSNLTINNASGISVSATTDITTLLTLTSGAVASGGNLTLKSTSAGAGGSAMVDFSGSGSVTGNVVVERFLDGATQEGFRYISPSVTGQTVAAVNDDLTLTGIGTTYSPGTNASTYTWTATNPVPNAYFYDESLVKTGTISVGELTGEPLDSAYFGWETPSLLSDALSMGEGIAVKTGTSDVTVDFSGPLQSSNVALSLTNGGQTNSGWHLIGNPFAATLDWDAVYDDGDNNGNVEPISYVFDASGPYAGSYAGYNAATNMAVNSGSKDVASGQAFFVQVTAAQSGSVTLKPSHTSSTDVEFFRTTEQHEILGELRLNLVDPAGHEDELLLYHIEEGAIGKDIGDAQKFFEGAYNIPQLASLAFGKELMMDCRKPIENGNQTYQLKLKAGIAGTHQLVVGKIAKYAPNTEIFLEDKTNNLFVNLNQQNSYSFELSSNDEVVENRFLIHLRTSRVTGLPNWPKENINAWSTSGQIHIQFNEPEFAKATIYIYSLLGKKLWEVDNTRHNQTNFDLTHQFTHKAVIVKIKNSQGVFTKKILLK